MWVVTLPAFIIQSSYWLVSNNHHPLNSQLHHLLNFSILLKNHLQHHLEHPSRTSILAWVYKFWLHLREVLLYLQHLVMALKELKYYFVLMNLQYLMCYCHHPKCQLTIWLLPNFWYLRMEHIHPHLLDHLPKKNRLFYLTHQCSAANFGYSYWEKHHWNLAYLNYPLLTSFSHQMA